MPMTDEQIQEIHRKVNEYLDGKLGRGFDIGNATHFDQLVAYAQIPGFPPENLELRVVVAISLLGPGGVPPRELCDDLLHQLQESFPDPSERQTRLMEMATVYGALLEQRAVTLPGWDQPWQGAVRMLIRAVEPAVRKANRWLADHLPGFPKDRHLPEIEVDDGFPQRTFVRSDATVLALRLIYPEKIVWVEEGNMWLMECTKKSGEIETLVAFEDRTGLPDLYATIPYGAKLMWRMVTQAILSMSEADINLAPDALCVLAARLTDALIRAGNAAPRPLPLGAAARIAGPATLAIFQCSCGTTLCAKRHRLASWNPIGA